MSAYCEVKTVYKDEKLLIESLQALGFAEVENHLGQKSALVGYSHEETVYADIIVRKAYAPGFSKDFGFSRQPDGSFIANINDMDSGKFDKNVKTPLANTYAEKAIRAKAKKLGLRIVGQKKVGKKLVLEYVKL